MEKHKYYDVIVAWAEGKYIEYKNITTKEWLTWNFGRLAPTFNPEREWRVKPETLRYRVALMKNSTAVYTMAETSKVLAARLEKDPGFVRWITDWTEVEITE